MTREIRPLQFEHLREMVRIERASFPDPWRLSFFAYALNTRSFSWGVFEDDRLLGYIIAFPEGKGTLHLVNLAVAPQVRRQGVASALLLHLFQRAEEQRVQKIYLEVRVTNGAAIALYQKFGFIITRPLPGYYPGGLDGWEMVWEKKKS